jgi:hypothetical protein
MLPLDLARRGINKADSVPSAVGSCERIIRRHGARLACTVARMLPDASQPPRDALR